MDEHLIEDGLWQRVLERLQREPHMHLHDPDALRRFVGACFAVLRRNCTIAKRSPGGDAAERHQGAELACFVSCSRGGLTSKVHHGVDSLGFVRRLLTSPGQRGDYTCAEALTAGLQPLSVVGDKAYNTDRLRTRWLVHGIGVCIPPKSNRLVQHLYNKAFYRTRHMVENSFCRLKDHRRLSLRLDKTETSFRAFACFAAALLNLQLEIKLCPQTLSAK